MPDDLQLVHIADGEPVTVGVSPHLYEDLIGEKYEVRRRGEVIGTIERATRTAHLRGETFRTGTWRSSTGDEHHSTVLLAAKMARALERTIPAA